MKTILCTALFFGSVLMSPSGKAQICSSCTEQIVVWTGAVSTDWNDSGNWDTNFVPSNINDVEIPSGTSRQPTLSAAVTIKSLWVKSGASLTIAATTGKLSIDESRTYDDGSIAFKNEGNVQNSGDITVGYSNYSSTFGLWNRGTFTNHPSAQLKLDNARQEALKHEAGTFINGGSIVVGSNSLVDLYLGILQESTFMNASSGVITINRTNIGIQVESGTFTNQGKINIGNLLPISSNGLLVNSTFDNYGDIEINRTNYSGIFVTSLFRNFNKVTIGNQAGAITYGIWVSANGSAINETGGQLLIDNISSALYVSYGMFASFTNKGLVLIAATGDIGDMGIINLGYFINGKCGIIDLRKDAYIDDSFSGFTNAGVIIERSNDYSKIALNEGLIYDLNGGAFSIASNSGTLSTTANQVYWTGCTSTDWHTASNWSTNAVPTANDQVVIPAGGTHQPTISAAAVAKSIEVESLATLTIANSGEVDINDFGTFDMFTSALFNAGTVQNSGKIHLGETGAIGTIGLINQHQFENLSSGEILIDKAAEIGLDNVGNFVNKGIMSIGSPSTTNKYCLKNRSSFENAAGAELKVNRAVESLVLNASGSLINKGKLIGGMVNTFTKEGIRNQTTLTNQTGGEISLNYISETAIFNTNQFTNSAKISVGDLASSGSKGIENQGSSAIFLNNNGGDIRIDRVSFQCITNNVNSTFTNVAKITIGAVAVVGTGIFNEGIFENNSGGEVAIDKTSSTTIYNNANTFTNAAKITLGALGTLGSVAVLNKASFNNDSGGTISIDNTGTNAIRNESGTFNNVAKITIGALGSMGGATIFNGAIFKNNLGGELILNSSGAILHNRFQFTNAAKIIIGTLPTNAFNAGIVNEGSSTTFSNDPSGEIIIDRTGDAAITLLSSSILANTGAIKIGTNAQVKGKGIWNRGSTFNNRQGGAITVEQVSDKALFNQGEFNNEAKITLSAASDGDFVIANESNFNNRASGDIRIVRADLKGISNTSSGVFTNSGKLTFEASVSASKAITNSANFNNLDCTALIDIYSNSIIENISVFNNSGVIIERASGNSSISSNTGLVSNLNGGTFSIGSGQSAFPLLTLMLMPSAVCGTSNGSISVTNLPPNTQLPVLLSRNNARPDQLIITSDASGSYTFLGLLAGNYLISLGTCAGISLNASLAGIATPFTISSSSPTVCAGGALRLSATTYSNASYSWLGPNMFSSNIQNPIRNSSDPTMSGTYSVTVRSPTGCTATATTSVVVSPNVAPSITSLRVNGNLSSAQTNTVAACTNAPVTLRVAATNAVTYSWRGPTGAGSGFTSSLVSPVDMPIASPRQGQYTVTVRNGCQIFNQRVINIQFINCSNTRLASAEDTEAIDIEINAYPNPVSKTLTVEVRLKEPSALRLNLVSSVGQESGTWQLGEVTDFHKTELNLADLQGGLYLLEATAGRQRAVKRVVKIQYE